MYCARLHLSASLSENDVGLLCLGFGDICQGNMCKRIDNDDNKPWLAEWYFETAPDASDLVTRMRIQAASYQIEGLDFHNDDFEIGPIPDENWLEKSYQEHAPFSVGPFFIYGSHYEDDVPDGQIGMQIDAVTAFGSGDHGTTKGCLRAMLDLKAKGLCPWNVLDMGCGSGILSVAAWKLWQTPITAIDIDEEAIRVTRDYLKRNDIKEGKGALRCATGDGFDTALVKNREPYDLIIANILAGPLVEMAGNVKAHLDDGGMVILSGMLKTQADDVLTAYQKQDLSLVDKIDIDKWSTLVLRSA